MNEDYFEDDYGDAHMLDQNSNLFSSANGNVNNHKGKTRQEMVMEAQIKSYHELTQKSQAICKIASNLYSLGDLSIYNEVKSFFQTTFDKCQKKLQETQVSNNNRLLRKRIESYHYNNKNKKTKRANNNDTDAENHDNDDDDDDDNNNNNNNNNNNDNTNNNTITFKSPIIKKKGRPKKGCTK